MTGRTCQTSRLPLSKAICAGDGRSVTSQRRAQHQLTVGRPAAGPTLLPRKWGHGSGARCSASRGPPPSSCTSTGPEGPGSASRPRPHPRPLPRPRPCRYSHTRSRWPRCLRWGRCGRVYAGRLPAATPAPAVPVYVGARLRPLPAPDACDLSGTQLGGRCVGYSGLACTAWTVKSVLAEVPRPDS